MVNQRVLLADQIFRRCPEHRRGPLAGNANNVTVNLFELGTLSGERMNRLDLRFAKILRFNRTRTTGSVDFYNALNSNAVLAESAAFATWLQPQNILNARFAKIGVQIDF